MSTTTPDAPVREVRVVWRGKQSEALRDDTLYLDLEGAIRSSKTTIGLWKVVNSCLANPGIRWLVCRWTDDALKATVKPVLMLILQQAGLQTVWHADEQRLELPNGAWIYLRGLRSSEDTNRFGRFRGLTLAGVFADQAEEIPKDIYLELKGRLSQVGQPKQMILAANPPSTDHWLASEFPEDQSHANHKLIRLTLYDNAHNLDPEYISQLEADYPLGHPLRRRLIDGQRGLSVVGEPVYAGYFQRPLHVVEDLACHPEAALYEGWDFGHGHPCVVWAQFLPIGALHVLGGVMGAAMFIEDFCPIALQYRAQWFPNLLEVRSTGDPAGESFSPHGVATSAFDVLAKRGVRLQSVPSANRVERRDVAIQSIAGYMRRLTGAEGAAFKVAPRFVVVTARGSQSTPVLVDGFEAGYVWDSKSTASTSHPNTRRPLKDGFYDHGQNGLEYVMLAFGPTVSQKKTAVDPVVERRYVDPVSMRNAWMA